MTNFSFANEIQKNNLSNIVVYKWTFKKPNSIEIQDSNSFPEFLKFLMSSKALN